MAYREVGEPRHRQLHRRVAEAMEQLYGDRLDQIAGLLASHFAEGGAQARAAHYAFRAGQRAAALAAWAEAASFYEQALAGADPSLSQGEDGARRLAILMALGQVRLAAGEASQAGAAFRAAQDLAEARGERDAADQARRELASTFIMQSRFAQVIALARQLRENPAYIVDAELLWGTALSLEGADLAEATTHLQLAAADCATQANPLHLAHIIFELGSVAAQQGDLLAGDRALPRRARRRRADRGCDDLPHPGAQQPGLPYAAAGRPGRRRARTARPAPGAGAGRARACRPSCAPRSARSRWPRATL